MALAYEEVRKAVVASLAEIEALDAKAAAGMLADPASDVELASLGIDSMKVVDFCMLVEKAVGREIDIAELIDNPTVNALAEFLHKDQD
ncbi:MAG: acyl carrier protein [Proteobacteria bacterium]|nr:acyl carrier protein [Pseudomonadota bacterium]